MGWAPAEVLYKYTALIRPPTAVLSYVHNQEQGREHLEWRTTVHRVSDGEVDGAVVEGRVVWVAGRLSAGAQDRTDTLLTRTLSNARMAPMQRYLVI